MFPCGRGVGERMPQPSYLCAVEGNKGDGVRGWEHPPQIIPMRQIKVTIIYLNFELRILSKFLIECYFHYSRSV